MKLQLALAALSCAVFTACAQAVNVLGNPGFETGSLAPWFASNLTPTVTNADAHSGNFSVAAFNLDEIRQNFAPVATSDITEVSLWLRRDGGPANAYSLYYSDAPQFSDFIVAIGSGDHWQQFDLTSDLTPGAHLTGISIFGTTPGPSYMDDFMINTGPIPEPSSAIIIAAIAGVAIRRRR